MNKKLFIIVFCIICAQFSLIASEFSPWSFFGGINFIYNADDAHITEIPGMNPDGSPGGLSSAPSPIPAFFGLEYSYNISPLFSIAPSISLWTIQYGFAKNRALPVEVENRTAYVPSSLIDIPLVLNFEKERITWGFGFGIACLVRYAFLEIGIPKDAQNIGEMTAQEQVDACNSFFWSKGRWFYPTVQTSIRYKLETGWGAKLILRTGIPIFNFWDTSRIALSDHLMILAALSISPPIKIK